MARFKQLKYYAIPMKRIWPWLNSTQFKIAFMLLLICTTKYFLAEKCRFRLQNPRLDRFVLSDLMNIYK